MFKPLIATLFVAALLPLVARAADSDHECHYGLQSDVSLDGNAVELHGDDGVWRLDGDRLRHDGHDVALNAQQRAAVDQYRRGMQTLVPATSGIALDAAMLGIEAMTMSLTAISDHPDEVRKYQKRGEQLSAKVHARFDGRELLRGSSGNSVYDDELDAEIQSMAEDAAADMAGHATSLIFMALFNPGKIEARADATERLVEARIEPKAEALEARARPLCGQFATLDALEPVIGFDAIVPQSGDDTHDGHHGFTFSF